MSSANRLYFPGLEELKAELRRLPEDLTGEAGHIVEGAANGAVVDIKQGYQAHSRSGNLVDHVFVSRFEGGKFSVGYIVKNTAPHAWIFENGTQARHTELGEFRGAMPPGRVFIPAAIRARRKMYDALKAMIARHGLEVSGDA